MKAGVLIDPHPSTRRELEAVVERNQVQLRCVLYTGVAVDEAAPAERRYDSLLAGLCLGRSSCEHPFTPAPPAWAGLPIVRPVAMDNQDGDCAWLPVHADGTLVRLHFQCSPRVSGIHHTILGGEPLVPSHRVYAELRVAVGGHLIEVIAARDGGGCVAYQVSDRLFTGHPLRGADATGRRTSQVLSPASVLERVPDHVVLYPSHVSYGAVVAMVGTERRAMEVRRLRPENVDSTAPDMSFGDDEHSALAGLMRENAGTHG